MNKMKTHWIIGLLLIVICMITSLLLVTDSDQPDRYALLFLLPLLYCTVIVTFIVFVPKVAMRNLGVIFFCAQSVIRCVVSPLFMYFGDYISLFRNITNENVFSGIILLIYEQLVCILAICIVTKKRNKRVTFIVSDKGLMKKLNNKRLGFILGLISLGCIALWFFVPNIKYNYTSIISMLSSGVKFKSDYTAGLEVGNIYRSLSTLFIVVFKSIRIIVPAYVIIKLYEKKSSFFHLLLSVIIISLQFMFIPDTIALSLIVVLLLFLLMYDLYIKYRRFLLWSGIGVVIIGMILVLNIIYTTHRQWYGIDNLLSYVSEILLSYFTGVDNVASVFRMPEVERLDVLWDTLFSAVPFQSTLFGVTDSGNTLNYLYEGLPGLNSQIIATVAGGFYIFGWFCAPLFSFIFMYVSTRFGYRYMNTNNHWKKISYLYVCLQSALGVGIYNIQITLTCWLQVAVPLLILARFAGKDNYEKGERA